MLPVADHILVKSDEHYTMQFWLRFVANQGEGVISGGVRNYEELNFDMTMDVRVCGDELITLAAGVTSTYVQVAARTSNASPDYLDFTNLESWFTVNEAVCTQKGFYLAQTYSYDIPTKETTYEAFPYENTNVVLKDDGGTYTLRLDQAADYYWEQLYLVSYTRGLITAARQLNLVVCDTSAFVKTTSYNEDLKYIFTVDPDQTEVET